MSISASRWAREVPVATIYERAVLVEIADRASDGSGLAWPHMETMAKLFCCSVRQIERAAKACAQRGQLIRERQKKPNGRFAGYVYRLPAAAFRRAKKEMPDPGPDLFADPLSGWPPPDQQSAGPPDCQSGHEPTKQEKNLPEANASGRARRTPGPRDLKREAWVTALTTTCGITTRQAYALTGKLRKQVHDDDAVTEIVGRVGEARPAHVWPFLQARIAEHRVQLREDAEEERHQAFLREYTRQAWAET